LALRAGGSRRVVAETVGAAAGAEFDVAVLVGAEDLSLDEPADRSLLYAALGRARWAAILVCRRSGPLSDLRMSGSEPGARPVA
jgi:superfamily I DNA and RNA helicase